MKLNRMIAFVMVLMFAAVLFAGCASEPVAEETTTETPAAEGATATEDTAARLHCGFHPSRITRRNIQARCQADQTFF